jgi:hypothetical protein
VAFLLAVEIFDVVLVHQARLFVVQFLVDQSAIINVQHSIGIAFNVRVVCDLLASNSSQDRCCTAMAAGVVALLLLV